MNEHPYLKEEWLKPGAVILSSMNLVFDDDFIANRAALVIDNWRMYEDWLEAELKRQKEAGKERKIGVCGTNFLN